jgi:hypothetical protein
MAAPGSTPSAHRGRRFTARSADLGNRLDIFLVTAIAAVLGNRFFLVLTGYPQLGNGTLHISHAIWGALMMAIAIVAAVSLLAPEARGFVAFVGGAGFGWFIDELGKFITRDVNYFFRPTFALIYITFVSMYLAFRAIGRRTYSPDEGVVNALEALKGAALGQLEESDRRDALALLESTHATGALALRVRDLLEEIPTMSERELTWPTRGARVVRQWYLGLTDKPRFPTVVDGVFVVLAAAVAFDTVALALDGPGIVTFAEKTSVLSAWVTSALIITGACWLPFSRPRAYRWFDRGLLFTIFVTQVFVYAEEQLAGTIGLLMTLGFWTLLRSAMEAEQSRAEPNPAGT